MASDEAHGHWDPFGRPLFDDPQARALSRVGVIDIGSNSVRMVVFDGAARSPAYFFNEKVLCGLGSGMAATGRLSREGRTRALRAVRRFAALGQSMSLPHISVVATAAMREATDGPEFRAELERETGLHVHVIDGTEEARLSAQGVLLGWPASYGLVCDIGGSSMELAEIHGGQVGRCITSPLGPLKLHQIEDAQERTEKIHQQMQRLAAHMGTQRDRLFLVGGSWRALARIDMARRGYPLHVLHEYRMDRQTVKETIAYLGAHDAEALGKECGISRLRMSLVPTASEVLSQLCATFEPKDIAISSYGIREGLLYEQMPQKLRDLDPLIEACRFAEAKDARLPGLGRALYRFVLPLFPQAPTALLRLIKAACLMHDVSWRAHPDYRAETCFDAATRANLGGLKHWERVFLGLALLHRYRNRREGTRFEALYDLMNAEYQAQAEVLGKAMRLGAMLWSLADSRSSASLDWKAESGQLVLRMSPKAAPLFGEVAEARLKSLAGALGADHWEMQLS